MVTSLKQAVTQYEDKVLNILELLLPELATGWYIQRGYVFGFGNYDEHSSTLVTNMDIEELNQVPINNIDAERAVGSINYELGVRGSHELDAASSCFLKGTTFTQNH